MIDHDPRSVTTNETDPVWCDPSVPAHTNYISRALAKWEVINTDERLSHRLNDALRGFHLSPGKPSLLDVYGLQGQIGYIIARAAVGLDSSQKTTGQLFPYFHQGFTLDVAEGINHTLDDIANKYTASESPSIQEKRGTALNPAHAAEYAQSLMQESFLPTSSDTTETEGDLYACLYATLLSGKSELITQFHKEILNVRDLFCRGNVHFNAIDEMINERPEKLPLLARRYGEDGEVIFEKYNFRALLDALDIFLSGQGADQADSHRQSMVNFAKKVTFDPDMRALMQKATRESLTSPYPELPELEQLDWEVLPQGELEQHAREIVEAARKRSNDETNGPTIDLRRLQILENIRKWWGEDKSAYAKGMRKTRRVVYDDAGAEHADEYIMLVLQAADEDGKPCEIAIGESPIAGENALYIQREDVNGWDWRELMAYPKQDVQDAGARAVKHVTPKGEDMTKWMTKKVQTLVTCSIEEFEKAEFKGRGPEGLPRLRLPPRILDHILEHEL